MTSFSTARMSYSETGKQSRVFGANAHQLIVILFDELLDLLDEIHEHLSSDHSTVVLQQQTSAIAILDSLIASLDQGSENQIATNLHLVYRQCKALIANCDAANELKNISAARQVLKEIASAWSEIG